VSQAAVRVGVDVGGTKVLAGVVDDAGRVVRTARRSTPGRLVEPGIVEDAIVDAVLAAAEGAPLAAVGLAAAGFVDAHGERVMFAPHLPWRGEPVRRILSDRLGVTVAMDNDANCAALAEWTYGVARGSASALMITLGTGIGGAWVHHGAVLRGSNGMAGEFGHMKVVPQGLSFPRGGAGCWEQYCSGNAVARYVRERTGDNEAPLTGPAVTDAARAGDPVAHDALAAVGDWLGVGTANLVAAFDPELVVVGGGLSAAGDLLLEPARSALVRSLVGAGHRVVPPIVPAALGPEAGLVGAAVLAAHR
jgi:glucokinase